MNITPYDQIIVGAGFAGLCTAIKLKEAGMQHFVILERNAHIGGTWYSNTYPGAACDVESHLYSFSFEPNPDWSRQFGAQAEILRYMEHCVERYELRPYIRLGTTVTRAVFDEQTGLWTVSTDSGEVLTTRSVVTCSGGLSQPAYPDIKGLDTFTGRLFHSAQWDNSYDLKGRSVAVIGTGASAIQIVPALANTVGQLSVYQRTAPWILPKKDKDISDFRRNIYRRFPLMRRLYRWRLYWRNEMMAIGFVVNPRIMQLGGKLVIRHLHATIKDESLRRQLTPNFVLGCKRILLSNDYYPALLRPNVSLITEPIAEIRPTGVQTKDGQLHSVDAIVLATGFQAAEGVSRFDVIGRGGLELNQAWRDGAQAYLGTSIAGFPNMYIVVGPNTGLGHSSMILMIEAQVSYIIQCLKLMQSKNARYAEVKKEVETEYNEQLQSDLDKTVWQSGKCMSWYQNKNGKNVALWPGFTFTFMQKTKKFEAEKYNWA